MFSANLKRNGRKWRTGAILLGSAFGFLGLLWSGLIVYVGLTARAEFAPMDVLTCQAAAAGEHGRSFSVVAGEIKNLADQSKEATIQVKSILGAMQKGINTSVMLTEEAVKRVEDYLVKHPEWLLCLMPDTVATRSLQFLVEERRKLVDRLSRDIDVATNSSVPMAVLADHLIAGLTERMWQVRVIGIDPISARFMVTV